MTDRRVNIFYAEFPRSAKPSDPHQHAGAEFIYVLNGRLVVSIDGTDVVLDEGDAVHFDSSAAHSYRLDSPQEAASAIVVIMPDPS